MMHLRYLRYVVLHKLYVLMAGLAVGRLNERSAWDQVCWVVRLIVHDWSKLLPSEWRPYATFFYADDAQQQIARLSRALHADPAFASHLSRDAAERLKLCRDSAEGQWSGVKKERQARFNHAWLLHIHRNPHHWQHWMLHEDSGKTLLLLPPSWVIDEMVADWIGAGTKVLDRPTLAEAIGATIKWYVDNKSRIQLRDIPRQRVEQILRDLAAAYGLLDLAYQQAIERFGARQSITMPTSPLPTHLIPSRR